MHTSINEVWGKYKTTHSNDPPIVTHFIHEAVKQCGGTFFVNPEFPVWGKIIALPNILWMLPLRDSNLE